MFCTNCGNEVKEGAAFCPACGTKTGGAADSAQGTAINTGAAPHGDTAEGAPVQRPQPAMENAPIPQPQPQANSGAAQANQLINLVKSKINKNNIWWIIFVASAAIYVLLGAIISARQNAGVRQVPGYLSTPMMIVTLTGIVSLIVAVVKTVKAYRMRKAEESYNKGLQALATNRDEAKEWFTKAKGFGHKEAVARLIEIRAQEAEEAFQRGLQFTERNDWDNAREELIKARDLGYAGAEAKISEVNASQAEECYNAGLLAMKNGDRAEAKEWFLKAKELTGHIGALAKLDEIQAQEAEEFYQAGLKAMSSDYYDELSTAVEWFEKAKESGHPDASAQIDEVHKIMAEKCYQSGLDSMDKGEQDKAKVWFTQAVEMEPGHAGALAKLAEFRAQEAQEFYNEALQNMEYAKSGKANDNDRQNVKQLLLKAQEFGHADAESKLNEFVGWFYSRYEKAIQADSEIEVTDDASIDEKAELRAEADVAIMAAAKLGYPGAKEIYDVRLSELLNLTPTADEVEDREGETRIDWDAYLPSDDKLHKAINEAMRRQPGTSADKEHVEALIVGSWYSEDWYTLSDSDLNNWQGFNSKIHKKYVGRKYCYALSFSENSWGTYRYWQGDSILFDECEKSFAESYGYTVRGDTIYFGRDRKAKIVGIALATNSGSVYIRKKLVSK